MDLREGERRDGWEGRKEGRKQGNGMKRERDKHTITSLHTK